MKIIDLVTSLADPNNIDQFILDNNLNDESAGVLIYMKHSLSTDSDIVFFNFEETDGKAKFEKDGVIYYSLTSISEIPDIIEYINFQERLSSNEQIANGLLDYIINDA